MNSTPDTYDPSDGIRTAVMADPRVQAVNLIGSRAAGTATDLSDWDYLIVSTDPAAVAACLPSLVAELKPLAQMWDPLAGTPVYMIILPKAVKADLFPGARASSDSASRRAKLPASLRDVDAHFWDWNLWLGAKRLRGCDELAATELAKMWRHLLRPVGVAHPPTTQREAISLYLRLRKKREQQLGYAVPHWLGEAVISRLQTAGLLPPVR